MITCSNCGCPVVESDEKLYLAEMLQYIYSRPDEECSCDENSIIECRRCIAADALNTIDEVVREEYKRVRKAFAQ